jgi:hypothetical protein
MKRPWLVTAIAYYFLIASIYFCAIGTLLLIMPRAVTTLRHAPFVYGIRLGGPYLALFVGVGWAVVAWELLRLRKWARTVAILLLGVGVLWAVPMMMFTGIHGWRLLLALFEISLRAAAVWYLLTPAAIETFVKDRASPLGRASL